MILQTRPAVEILFELLKIQDGGWQIENVVLMDIINSLLNGNKTANINAKKLQFIHTVNDDGSKTAKIIKRQC